MVCYLRFTTDQSIRLTIIISIDQAGKLIMFQGDQSSEQDADWKVLSRAARQCSPYRIPDSYRRSGITGWQLPVVFERSGVEWTLKLDWQRADVAATLSQNQRPNQMAPAGDGGAKLSQIAPPAVAPPLPLSSGARQGSTASATSPPVFPITDGTYLPTHSRCSSYDIDDDRDARRYIGKGGEEMAFRGGSCRRISYGPNSAGIGVVWKCEVEGDPQTIYQTIKPKGRAFEISEWIVQIRGHPRIETYELCPAVTILRSTETPSPTARSSSSTQAKQPNVKQSEAKTPTPSVMACPFDGTWRVQVEASCARFGSTAIIENCKIVRGGHLRNASGSVDPSTGTVAYRVAASDQENTPGGNGTGTLRRDQKGSGKIKLGAGCDGSMRWRRE